MAERKALKLEYDGSRDIEIREGTWNAKPFKVRATSESGNPAHRRMSRTWRFATEDGTEYRIQIQEVSPVSDIGPLPDLGSLPEGNVNG